jgi:hypothetical protein
VGEGGLEATEVGKELAEHAKHAQSHEPGSRHDRIVSIIEAMLLAVVAVLAAWSGFASAKWGTESRLRLAQAAAARTQASSATLAAMELRDFDASTFNAWFTAYTAGDASAMAIAERRFRPEFKVAFDAWQATNPATNPNAPPGPTFMPQYREPDAIRAARRNADADRLYLEGAAAGGHADDYVRITVYLATVLFLTGISGHFRVTSARIGLIVVGSGILIWAATLLILAPKPPAS